jgi:hypothetical protein
MERLAEILNALNINLLSSIPDGGTSLAEYQRTYNR